ncbi:hypothetical protein [Porphyromonas levii]|uniref:hypothetical protein n=1 Tax=Porphyromonas levii TaxID=28114 RepID=UPI001BAC668B|nr:hypothetical protein [Porphyromonas levii]
MRSIRYHIIIGVVAMLALAAPLGLHAQEVRVIPKLERSTILIGEQVQLNVRVVYPSDQAMRLVLPEDTLVAGVEIIESVLADSVIVNNRLHEMIYNVTITSFDSATYTLRNINALVGDSVYTATDELNLIVNTVPIDLSTSPEPMDIKGQWKPKFVWQDYILYLYILLGIIAALVAAYYLRKYLRGRKNTQEEGSVVVPLQDPYQEAIQSIEALKQQELWEHNQTKEYYTQMTDILRRYLWRVYSIDTMDKTSSEILETFRTKIGKDRMYSELSKILQTADLAKFAKYQPDSDDNISLLSASVAFIEEHKPAKEEPKKEGGEEV